MTLSLVLIPLLVGCGDDGAKSSSSSAVQTTQAALTPVTVSITDKGFRPAKVTVREGQPITWRNDGLTGHTVTASGKSAGAFDSGTIFEDGTWGDLRLAAGRYTYRCDLHPTESGVIIVKP